MIRFVCDRCGRSSAKPLPYFTKIYRTQSAGMAELYQDIILCGDCAEFLITEISGFEWNGKEAVYEHKTN